MTQGVTSPHNFCINECCDPQAFKALDKDGSGTISLEELGDALRKFGIYDDAKELLAEADANQVRLHSLSLPLSHTLSCVRAVRLHTLMFKTHGFPHNGLPARSSQPWLHFHTTTSA